MRGHIVRDSAKGGHLSVISMRQQHHQGALVVPFVLPAGDEGVDKKGDKGCGVR